MLTEIQRRILLLVIKGYEVQDIAEELSMHGGTVRYHRKALISNLHAANLANAIAKAYQLGELPLNAPTE